MGYLIFDTRTKWKRHTTPSMRADEVRNHVCNKTDCPGLKRLATETRLCSRCHLVADLHSNNCATLTNGLHTTIFVQPIALNTKTGKS